MENKFNLMAVAKAAPKSKQKAGLPEGRRIVATASSDSVDLAGDRMAISALEQMRDDFATHRRTIFLNHSYNVPEDVFGHVVSASLVKRGRRTNLDIVIAVDDSPRALAVLDHIENGQTMGVSIGVIVNSAQYVVVEGERVLEIESVTPLEASIVGIPANRDSWVREAFKAASLAVSTRGMKVDGGPVDGSEVAVLRFALAVERLKNASNAREVEETRRGARALVLAVNEALSLPMPRKAIPADQIFSVVEKYPWLDARIASELAREAHSNA